MFDETGCDGLLIAAAGWATRGYSVDRVLFARRHDTRAPSKKGYQDDDGASEASIKCFGIKRAVPSFRKFFSW
jgi:hypothetical protein